MTAKTHATGGNAESALIFPCEFPIKALGRADCAFAITVAEIVGRHVPNIPADAVKSRPSKKGKYTSVTVTIVATNRRQLDAIYQDLTACERVIMAL